MRYYLPTLLLILAGATLSAQPETPDSLGQDSIRSADNIDIGYGQLPRRVASTAITQVGGPDFNQGLISDPMQLVQGKMAGLQVYNRGGNPNQRSLLRLRGTSLGAAPNPLVIIDGIMGATLDNIDPNDIESITVLKDASATAIYGSQAASGAILIRTKDASQVREGTRINYHGQGAVSQVQNQVQVMDADEFRAAGGMDLGASTNWGDEITRRAWSQAHGLSLSGTTGDSHFRLSGNYRGVEGVLLNAGFTQANARLQFGTKAFDERLSIQAHGAFTSRQSDLSFPEAFQHAVNFNPTAPIFSENGSDQYGGYYENIGVFNSFNPVSMLEQNDHAQRQSGYTIGMKAAFQITDHLELGGRLGTQSVEAEERAYYPVTALYRGNAASTTRKGRADYRGAAFGFDLLEAYTRYDKRIGELGLNLLAGYQRQTFFNEADGQSYVDLENSTYDFLGSFNPPNDGQAQFAAAFRSVRPEETISALFARATADWRKIWSAQLSIRRDHSDLLREDAASSFSTAFSLAVDLNHFIDMEQVQYAKVRAGYGLTGNLPNQRRPDIASVTSIVDEGTFPVEIINANSPGLTPERQTEFNVGLELASPRLQATLDLYSRRIDELILLRVGDPILVSPRYGNAGQLQTRGAELSLAYDVLQTAKASWNTGIILSTFRSTLESYLLPADVRGNLGSPGQNGTFPSILREGEAVGQLWGPVYEGVSPSGEPTFADLNGDGQVVATPGNALDENADFQVLGNGRPSLELGWANQFSFGSWSVHALVRGAFGHSMVNTPRAFYEPRVPSMVAYNNVNTELAVEELTTARFSSLYVERADFLKLDNLSLAKRFAFRQQDRSLTLSLTAQNLLLWTNYTGVDPEPALVDYGPATGAEQIDYGTPDYAATGIDRRYSYWPAWSVVLGLQLAL